MAFLVSQDLPRSSILWERGAPMVLQCRRRVDVLVRRGFVRVRADQCVSGPRRSGSCLRFPSANYQRLSTVVGSVDLRVRVRVGMGERRLTWVEPGMCRTEATAAGVKVAGNGAWSALLTSAAAPPGPPRVGDHPDPPVGRARAGPLRVAPDVGRRLRGRVIDAAKDPQFHFRTGIGRVTTSGYRAGHA